MKVGDWVLVVACVVIGAGGGWLLAGPGGAIGGAIIGGLLGGVAAVMRMRSIVAVALVTSLAIGAVIGQGIVHALCLPEGCPPAEAVGAGVTSIAALIAVGLVMALVTRSFDEYREAVAARRPPPEPGCETHEQGREA